MSENVFFLKTQVDTIVAGINPPVIVAVAADTVGEAFDIATVLDTDSDTRSLRPACFDREITPSHDEPKAIGSGTLDATLATRLRENDGVLNLTDLNELAISNSGGTPDGH